MRGSLVELEGEYEGEVVEWKVSCGVRDESDGEGESLEKTAEGMAEMAKFSFSPESRAKLVKRERSSRSQTPYLFSAGGECNGKLGSLDRAHSRALLRAKARKAGVPWFAAPCGNGENGRRYRQLARKT